MAKKNENFDEMKAQKLQNFDKALDLVNKMFKTEGGEPVLTKMGAKPRKVETISSGSLVLDSLLGGGLAKGRVIEIMGPEASGKTSVALTAVGNVQREGGTAVFIDLENALDPVYAQKLGVNIPELAITQPDNAEQALDLVENLVQTGAVDIIVVDSVAALTPKAELEGEMADATVGIVAKYMAKICRKIVKPARENKCTVIFINQFRDKIGVMYGPKETTTGGKALQYTASQRVDVRRKEQIKEGKEIIGNKVKMKVIKNKIAPPFREGETVLTYNQGINRAAEIVEVGPEVGIISVTGRTYTEEETGNKIATSKGDAVRAIETDPELYTRLSNRLSAIFNGEEEAVDNGLDETLDEEI